MVRLGTSVHRLPNGRGRLIRQIVFLRNGVPPAPVRRFPFIVRAATQNGLFNPGRPRLPRWPACRHDTLQQKNIRRIATNIEQLESSGCDRRRTRSAGGLVLQLQIALPEGAGGFSPLKTGQRMRAFRPGTGQSATSTTVGLGSFAAGQAAIRREEGTPRDPLRCSPIRNQSPPLSAGRPVCFR